MNQEAGKGGRKGKVQESDLDTTSELPHKHLRSEYRDNPNDMATDSNFVDLSGSIVTRSMRNNNPNGTGSEQSGSLPSGNVAANLVAESSNSNRTTQRENRMRDTVTAENISGQRTLEEKMKMMVRGEMDEIRRSIVELSKVVKELSVTRSQYVESNHASQNRPSQNADSYNGINNINQPRNVADAEYDSIRNNGPGNMDPNSLASQQRNSDKMGIRVDKWGIVFNGNNTHLSIEDFIFRIEHLQSHYDISWDEILRDFHLLVTGAAKDWYWLLVKTHGALRWPTLKSELRNQYQTNISNFEIMRDLVERKQQPNESLDTFFFEMSKLRSRLMQPIPEYDMVKILKRNLKESIARIVYPIAVSSVEQLRMECQEAERNFPKREIRNNYI